MAERRSDGRSSLGALRDSIRDAPSMTARIEAVEVLAEEHSDRADGLLAEIVRDDGIDVDVRLKAITALANSTSDTAVAALVGALASDSQEVIRRAAERLGALPGTDQLEPLKRVRTGNAVTRDAVRFAKLLVSYRNRLGEYRLQAVRDVVVPDPGQAVEAVSKPLPRSLAAEVAALVADPIFGIECSGEGAATFECGANRYVALLHAEFARRGPSWLAAAQGLPVVVLQRSLETGELVVSHVVMSDPERDGGARLQVARQSGAVVMTGTATISDDGVSFELASVVTPHMPPTTITGRYDGPKDRLVLDRLLMARALTPQQRSLIRAPTLQAEPLSASRDST